MEMGNPKGSVTVFALADGNASIYLATGGGFIGGIGHAPIRVAAQHFVFVAADFVDQMRATAEFPLPANGEVTFYLLTDRGVVTASAPEQALGEKRHPLSPLFYAGQGVITSYRELYSR